MISYEFSSLLILLLISTLDYDCRYEMVFLLVRRGWLSKYLFLYMRVLSGKINI